jgi:hypothetical protein
MPYKSVSRVKNGNGIILGTLLIKGHASSKVNVYPFSHENRNHDAMLAVIIPRRTKEGPNAKGVIAFVESAEYDRASAPCGNKGPYGIMTFIQLIIIKVNSVSPDGYTRYLRVMRLPLGVIT